MGLSWGPERSWQRVAVCGGVCLGKRASLGGGVSRGALKDEFEDLI